MYIDSFLSTLPWSCHANEYQRVSTNTANILNIGLRRSRNVKDTRCDEKLSQSVNLRWKGQNLVDKTRGWARDEAKRGKRKKAGKVAKRSRHGAPRRYLPRNWWPWCSAPLGLELCFSNYRGYMSVSEARELCRCQDFSARFLCFP